MNRTKCQLVRAQTLRKVKMTTSPGRFCAEYLTIGAAVLFLTVCTDDWGFVPRLRRDEVKEDDEKTRAPLGAWAGEFWGPRMCEGICLIFRRSWVR